jgi:hypothetical protein
VFKFLVLGLIPREPILTTRVFALFMVMVRQRAMDEPELRSGGIWGRLLSSWHPLLLCFPGETHVSVQSFFLIGRTGD